MRTLFSARSIWPARFAALTIAAFLYLSVTEASFAQRHPAQPKRPTPFARYVPASANLFITIDELGEVDGALRRAHARQLLPLITGGQPESGPSLDLRRAVTRFLGPESSVKIEELLAAEVGIAADSWAELGGAVWFVRAPGRKVLEGWFPRSRRTGGDSRRPVWSFRTRDGLRVMIRGDIVAMARRSGAGSLLSETGRLMIGRGGEALEQSPAYQELFPYLPGRALAIAYLSRSNSSPDDTSSGGWLWPDLDQAVIGMYEQDGRMDFAIRGRRSQPQKDTPVSLEAFGRLVQLPATTLVASATTIDFRRSFTEAAPDPASPTLGHYLRLLASFGTRGSNPAEFSAGLGPQVITTWDQDLGDTGATPQIAFLVQSGNARAVRDELTQIARNVVKLIGEIDPVESGAAAQIGSRSHLGTPVVHLSFGSRASQSKFSSLRLLSGVQPAWAAWGDWLIFALSPVHIQRILDAQHGLIPTLASVEDVGEVNYYRANRTSLSFVQARLAVAVLERWLDAYESGAPSLLASSWWGLPEDGVSVLRQRFGIQIGPDARSGVVVVAAIDSGSPAEKTLRVDDRIIGVGGELLSLREPDQDLRRRLEGTDSATKVTLRVQRGDTMLDVSLPHDPDRFGPTDLINTPAEGVRELASLGRTLQFATFSVHATSQEHYSARLTLRFTPTETAVSHPIKKGR